MTDIATPTTPAAPISLLTAVPGHQNTPGEAPTEPALANTSAETVPSETKVEDPRQAARFAEMSRRDKAIRQREQAIKAKEAQLDIFSKADELFKTDPLKLLSLMATPEFLAERGMSDVREYYLDALLRDGRQPTVDEKLQSVQQKVEAMEKARHDAEQARVQDNNARIISNFKNDIRGHIDNSQDKYELIATEKAYEDVYETVVAWYEESGEVMPIERACDHVEDLLLKEVQKFAKAKKVRALYAPEPDVALGDRQKEARRPGAVVSPGVGDSAPSWKGTVSLTNGNVSSANPSLDAIAASNEERKTKAMSTLRFK